MIKQSYNLDEVFRTFRTKMYWLAFSISRNEKDAEDILQNTFVKIVRSINTFEGRSSLSTWIYKVTYNEALMFLRKRSRQARLSKYLHEQTQKIPHEIFTSPAKTPDDSLVDNEVKSRLNEAIARMPIKYRMAIILHNMEGMSMKDTADIMRLKLNSLKTRLHRAYAMMRAEVGDYLKDKQSRVSPESEGCRPVTRFLVDYVHGSLADSQTNRFRRVISHSAAARGFLNSYGRAISMTKALQCRDLPSELKEKVEHFLRV